MCFFLLLNPFFFLAVTGLGNISREHVNAPKRRQLQLDVVVEEPVVGSQKGPQNRFLRKKVGLERYVEALHDEKMKISFGM